MLTSCATSLSDLRSQVLISYRYAKTPTKIGTNLETGLPQLDDDLVDKLQRTKFENWRYEQEMRVYVQLDRDAQESGLYFYPFDSFFVLTEVILGPRCELPTEGLGPLLGSHTPEIKLIKTTLDSRSFSVIEGVERRKHRPNPAFERDWLRQPLNFILKVCNGRRAEARGKLANVGSTQITDCHNVEGRVALVCR
jgi:hypothetical protein